jgi:hypothetical protein
MNFNSENQIVNISQNSINNLHRNDGEQSQTNSLKKHYKNAIFYLFASFISIAFLIFSRDLVIKHYQNQINQKMRILEEIEIEKEENHLRFLHFSNDYVRNL